MSKFKVHSDNTPHAEKLKAMFNLKETCEYLRTIPLIERIKLRDSIVTTLLINTCNTTDEIVGALERYKIQFEQHMLGRIKDRGGLK